MTVSLINKRTVIIIELCVRVISIYVDMCVYIIIRDRRIILISLYLNI